MFNILSQIWECTWYEVLIIAFLDDGILFLKLWPVWCFSILLIILLYVFFIPIKNKKEK